MLCRYLIVYVLLKFDKATADDFKSYFGGLNFSCFFEI